MKWYNKNLERELNKQFPKGDKARGKALVLFAFAQIQLNNIIMGINQLIIEEKKCMKQDEDEEQVIEHTNQIEMAKKIKKIIEKEVGK